MAFSIILLPLLFVFSSMAAHVQADDNPWFCHGLHCPDYSVEKTTDDWEVRKYAAGVTLQHM